MSEPAPIQRGCRVCLQHEILLEDGTVADSSFDEEPICITIGQGDLHPAFEHLLIGLIEGDERSFEIPPETGFGEPDPDLIRPMPRSEFPRDFPLQPGLVITMTTPTGEELPAMIRAVDRERVLVDLNHPFAGHTLTFRCRIRSVEPAGD
ncbi:MAG: peptidylprolyl isomerase [Gammaproteobacteria bacterium]|nr:MAG: peptidylprolyl isomerase [Gammaproteobacteria bacterium]